MERLGLAAALCLLSANPVLAQDRDQQAAQGQPAAEQRAVPPEQRAPEAPPTSEEEDDRQRMVCRTQPVTGSLTRRNRICQTAAEWQSLERRTGQQVGNLQRGGSGGLVPAD